MARDRVDELVFHDEMRRAARVSRVIRHERVVGGHRHCGGVPAAEEGVEKNDSYEPMSLWAKLLHATRGRRKKGQGCSLAARGKAFEERTAMVK
jgi:carbonic anhydrase